MTDQGLFNRTVSGARWIALSKAISQGVMWVATIYVMRLLQPSDYGIATMGGTLTILAGMLLDGGLSAAFIQRRDVSIEVYRSANTALMISSVVAIVIVQLLAEPAAAFFHEPLLGATLRVASIQFIFSAASVIPTAVLSSRMSFKELGLCQAVAGVVSSIVTLGLAWAGAGVWSLIIGVLSASITKLIMLSFYTNLFIGFSSKLSLLRSYLSFSKHLIAQRMLWFLVEQADQIVIGRVLGSGPLGIYSVARNLSHIPLDRTVEIVNQVSLPAFSAVQDDRQRWHGALAKLMRLSASTSFPVFWGMAAVAPVAIPAVLGSKWTVAIAPFILFCLILPLRSAHALTGTVLLALGRADLSFKSVLVWAVLLSPLFLVGAQFGVAGVAAAWAIGFPIVYAVSLLLMHRELDVHVNELLRSMLLPAVAALGCALAVLGLAVIIGSAVKPIQLLVMQIIVGAIIYAVLLYMMTPSTVQEFVGLARGLMGASTKQSAVEKT